MITKINIEQYLSEKKAYIDSILTDELSNALPKGSVVSEACRYAVLNGGKRIRPILALSICDVFGKPYNPALPFAIALEFIHCYSLIHDDLPCMDDDTTRRGKPTTHVKFGESTALLAGDALLTCAFDVAASANTPRVSQCIRVLCKAAGVYGMIGGQALDLACPKDIDSVITMNRQKTGALISAAVELGCIAANASKSDTHSLINYADNIGIAFQLRDDILNAEGDPAAIGKPTGSDAKHNKINFVTLLGLEPAKKSLAEYTDKAKHIIANIDNGILTGLADYLLSRNS